MNRRTFLALSALSMGSALGWATVHQAQASGLVQASALPLTANNATTPGAKVITGVGKEIFVSLSRQRLWSYVDGEVEQTFLISSGLAERATKAGNFKVQSKYPEAWSSVWRMRMPYWMGIYDVGRIENGIHAMPLRRSGALVRWPVGVAASYGCVVANTPEAASLYRWAPLGTPVYIRY